MHRLLIALTVLLSFARVPAAMPAAPPETRTLSPYFFVKSNDPSVDRLPLKATSAAVDIVGVIARVKVTQVYRNEGRHTLEALYVFPGSTRAAVHGMTMKIGERVITARIEERQEARRQYTHALQSGRTASLLEQQRPNVFQVNVANILPGDELKVELLYSELLVPDKGTYEFVYPTVVGPRYSTTNAASAPESERWVENPYLRQGEQPAVSFDFQARIVAGMPLLHVGSPSHDVKVEFAGRNRASVSLNGKAGAVPLRESGELGPERVAANRDLVLSYQLADSRIETGVLLGTGGDENVFLCMIEPPRRVAPRAVPPRDYVFIMDVSGSMNGFPIQTSKELFRALLAKLGARDFFNVLFFAGGTWVLSPTSLEATESNKAWALQEIERQHGGGGTELLPALRQAFDLPRAKEDVARSIVIATDGYVNVEREAFTLVRNRLGDASVFAFGIGTAVNRHLISGLASAGEGEPFVVSNAADARKSAARFLEYIQSPLLTRVEVRTPGFDAYDVEPARLPDLFAERPVLLVGKYRGAATGEIVITGFTGDGRFERRIRMDAPRAAANDVLKLLWARERLTLLSDLATGDGPDAERRQEVTALGLRYGLLTEFTSFVAIDERVRRQDGRVETVKQPLPLPEGVSDFAVGDAAVQLRGVAAGAVLSALPAAPGNTGAAKSEARQLPRIAERVDPARESGAPTALVQVVENRLLPSASSTAGSAGQRAKALSEALRKALEKAGCGQTGSVARLKITFGADGAVNRVEGGAAGGDCVKRALQASGTVIGVTGGYVVVVVTWR